MEFQLKDLAGTAGSTVGLIIATSIFLQVITTKFASTFDRYRALTGEFRNSDPSDERKKSLEDQIRLYFRRCMNLQQASLLLILAEFCFLAAVLLVCSSIVFPQFNWIKFAGAATLLAGLALITFSAGLELQENQLSGKAIESEMNDMGQKLKEHPDWLHSKAA
jgi:hypothetical protein